MFCRRCRYDLNKLKSPACPECGASFDAADTRTFHAVPHRPRLGVFLLVLSFLLVVGGQGILWLLREHLPAWPPLPQVTVLLLAAIGPVVAGWRADFSVPYLLYGAACFLVLLFADDMAVLEWPQFAPRRPWVLSLLIAMSVLVAGMVGARLIGRHTWRWRNRRRALAARRPPRPTPAWRRWLSWRRVGLGLGALLLLVSGWLTFELVTLTRTMPIVRVNYHEQLAASFEATTGVARADSHAAWQHLTDTLVLMETTRQEFDDATRAGGFTARTTWDDGSADFSYVLLDGTPVVLSRERAALAALDAAGVYERMHEFTAGPIARRPETSTLVPNPPLMTAVLPMLASMRQLARTQAAAMRMAALDGDYAAVSQHFDVLMAMVETLAQQRTLIDWLVAAAITALGLDELSLELLEGDFDEASCRRLLATLETRRIVGVDTALAGERATFHDTVQRTFTDDGNGDGYVHPTGGLTLMAGGAPAGLGGGGRGAAGLFGAARAAFSGRFLLATRREQVERFERAMETLMTEARLPPYERWGGGVPPEDLAPVARSRYHLADAMRPHAGYLRSEGPVRTQIEGVRLLVALELFHRLHERWPDALVELTPECLATVPVDPINGQPFGYRRQESDDAMPFILYSFGRDGTDDGGEFETGRMNAGWRDATGVDVPITNSRRSHDW